MTGGRCGLRLDRAGMTMIELLSVLVILGTLTSMALPRLGNTVYQAQVAKAIGDIRAIQIDLQTIEANGDTLPSSLGAIGRGSLLDPWGNPYQYLKFAPKKGKGGGPPGQARKDRFLVPINSTYDLYSMGRDGKTASPLTASSSRDDIVRANDGGFIGLAWKF